MTDQKKEAPKAVRASLMAIWRGLKRCSYRFPSIYHELWEPQLSLEEAMPEALNPVSMIIGGSSVIIYDVPDVSGIGDSFRKANDNFDVPYPWKWWHEPSGARYFGCFYGDDGAVWDDFKRLADSAYLVLCQVDRTLSQDDRFHGWIDILHKMAYYYPTPLLRSWSMVWRFWECESEVEHERWIKPEHGAAYPQHPICWTLEHDVVTSSMAAIELILDDERALLVGRRRSNFPISYPGEDEAALQKAIDACRARSEVQGEGPVLLFELHGREWHFEYDSGYGVQKATYLEKGKPSIGFKVCRYLRSKPDEWVECDDIFKETGQAHKLKGAFTRSHQKRVTEESKSRSEEAQTRLWKRYNDTIDEVKKRKILDELEDIAKAESGPKSFPTDDSKFATHIQLQIDNVIPKINGVLSDLASYLDQRLIRRGCRFIYARDNGLYQALLAGGRKTT